MAPIIAARGLGKRYTLSGRQATYHTVRESIMRAVSAGIRRRSAAAARSFWALRDVNFHAEPGEVIGIIGRNGAGKSTLLKILSRITEPTEGEVDLYGRVGCLLEVGTGFHSELTGRANVFLSGAILGMTREEIVRKFDDIVAFAEVDGFLDTPVKHYSSGMHTRLAFSVAAHLEPEILVIDEVLAVGDTAFQQKCLGKMGDAARHGRTVLFVSHNVAAIRRLCRRVLLLEAGRVVLDGDAESCIERYLATAGASGANDVDVSAIRSRHGFGGLRFERLMLCTPDNRAVVAAGRPLDLRIVVRAEAPANDVELSVAIDTSEGVRVCESPSDLALGRFARLERGTYRLSCRIEPNVLNPGQYAFALTARAGQRIFDEVPAAMPFEVAWTRDGAAEGREDLQGLVRVGSAWTAPVRLDGV